MRLLADGMWSPSFGMVRWCSSLNLFRVLFGVTLLGSVKMRVRHARIATPARNCFGMRMLVPNRGNGFPRSVYCAGIVGEPN